MGVSELFVMVASFEFAYLAAPRSAQTLFMSLRFCAIGLSSFIGTGYIAAFKTKSSSLDFTVSIEIANSIFVVTFRSINSFSVHLGDRKINGFILPISIFLLVFSSFSLLSSFYVRKNSKLLN
jgi:hypothetical protein